MSRTKTTTLFLALILALLLAACSTPLPSPTTEAVAPAPTQGADVAYPAEEPFIYPTADLSSYPAPGEQPAGDPTAILFTVVLPDGNSVNVTRANLDTLSTVTLDAAGQQKSGPLLTDLLTIAGAAGYQRITVQGTSNSLTLEAADINEQVILDLSDPAGAALVGAALDSAQWVSGITAITIE